MPSSLVVQSIPNAENFKNIQFNNLSTESTNYLWDFGEGVTSTEKDPSHTFALGEGKYPVTLTSIDNNEAASSITIEVNVVDKFVPLPGHGCAAQIGKYRIRFGSNGQSCAHAGQFH